MNEKRETAWGIAVVALFLMVRLALLVVREPFFDELFTVWMASRPLTGIVPALLLDSGPPLYYFVARVPDVIALRVLSLIFATGTLGLILTRKSLGESRWLAAALLTVHPAAALFAVDARAYALCGLLITLGVLAVHDRKPFFAAAALLLGAYTHWYGALFLPLVLLARPFRRAVAAAAVAALLFLPGLWLASRQPAGAMAWIGERPAIEVLAALAFVGDSPEALFKPAPMAMVLLSAVAVVLGLARSFAFAPMVLIPVVLACAAALVGRTVYVPMRFESVLAGPLVLWLAASLPRWRREVRYALIAILAGCGVVTIAMGIADHARRPVDPYREAALVLRRNLGARERVVASGYLYLEAVHQLGEQRVVAWPAEQGRHPGWRVKGPLPEAPDGPFLWIGERAAPELAAIRPRGAQVLYANERALILRVR